MQYAVGSGSRQLTGQRHVLVLLKNLLVSSWKNLPRRVSKQMLPWPVETGVLLAAVGASTRALVHCHRGISVTLVTSGSLTETLKQ